MRNKKLISVVALLMVACLVVGGTLGVLLSIQYVTDTGGEIIGVGIELYEDAGLTVAWSSQDWGSLYPEGEGMPCELNITRYVKNIENYEVGLTLTTEGHEVEGVPESPDDMFAWAVFSENCTGQTIPEYGSVAIWVCFHANFDAPQGDDFEFDIKIVGEPTL